ncbi:MAG TPA: anti-sigma factor [Solirubrobacteraceae bacterium]|jgi:anti-sigma-K factor RskA|nr:anti-sigma factor [Solirubrobacteraceae bacterium]
MSDRDRTTDRRECGGDVAAYALGALDAAEADAFRRHLESCSVCQEELTAFQHVVHELPLAAAPHKAPSAIRRKVMREVNADARAARTAAGSGRRARRFGSRVPRPALALGLAVVVAAAVVVGVVNNASGPGARVLTGQVVGSGNAQLRIVPGRASLVVHHFAQPPAGKIYQVWIVHGKNAPSPTMALFSPTSAGNAVVGVPGNLKGVSSVLVTPEPMGGSQHPTHAPVISVPLD